MEYPVPDPLEVEQIHNAVIDVTQFPGGDLGEKINNAIAEHGRDDITYLAKGGEYTISTVADLTDFHNAIFDFRGAYIHLATADKASIDLSDSWDYKFLFGILEGDETDTPSCGILSPTQVDVPSSTGSGDQRAGGPERKWIMGNAMWGSYKYAPLIHQGRERTRIMGDFSNDNNQG